MSVAVAFLLSVIIVALAVGIVVSRRVTRRVALLADATEKVGQGDLSVEVPSDGKDEIAEGAQAITNRERWLVRETYRNSYELTEFEIDEIITDALKGVDVDERHEAQLEHETSWVKQT